MICAGCAVRGGWEHRCHGEWVCDCPDCREADRLFPQTEPTQPTERAGRNEEDQSGARKEK